MRVELTRAALRVRCAANCATPAFNISARNRTWSSTFVESNASGTPRRCKSRSQGSGTRPLDSSLITHHSSLLSVPQPGVEPRPRPSEGRMMSVSPPGRTTGARNQGSGVRIIDRVPDSLLLIPVSRRLISGGWGRTSVSGFRARRSTAKLPRSFLSVAQVEFEPTASLILSQSGRPSCLPSQN